MSWYKKITATDNFARIGSMSQYLLNVLKNRPNLRKVIGKVINKIPIHIVYKGKVLGRLSLDWVKDDEILELEEQALISPLSFIHTDASPNMIFDIGASCGISTTILSIQKPSARIRAYEPRGDAFVRLEKRLGQLRGDHHCYHAALDLREGSVRLQDHGVGTSFSANNEKTFSVQTLAIDKEVSFPCSMEVLIKIDVEGAEARLLPQILPKLNSRSVLLLETHHPLSVVQGYAQPFLSNGFVWNQVRYRDLPEYGGPFSDWLIIGKDIKTN
jgi:FkbM family methyltransferase